MCGSSYAQRESERRRAEQAERDKHEREARALQKALDEKVAKAKRNPQLVPVEAR